MDRATNASCSKFFLGNLTRYASSVSSLGFEVWTLGTNGTGQPRVAFNDGSMVDAGLAACVRQINARFPDVKIGLCGSTSASALGASATDPPAYVE